MKKSSDILREYAVNLNDDDLLYLYDRLSTRFAGDFSDVLNFLSKNHKMDRYLSSTTSGEELFNILDSLTEQIRAVINKRNL